MSHLVLVPAAMTAGDLLGLLHDTTLFGKIILLILLVLSILSWAVMIDKGRTLAQIRNRHVAFWRAARDWLETERADALTTWCQEHPDSPLAALWLEAAPEDSPLAIRRACERITWLEVENLERYLIILSTTVTIAPFLGLMGTVWGIMQAFWDMQALRSANLAVVAPGIAEALITTIAGLSAAIPAVVFYNLFVRKIDLVANEMDRLRTLLEERAAGSGTNGDRLPRSRRPDIHPGERIP